MGNLYMTLTKNKLVSITIFIFLISSYFYFGKQRDQTLVGEWETSCTEKEGQFIIAKDKFTPDGFYEGLNEFYSSNKCDIQSKLDSIYVKGSYDIINLKNNLDANMGFEVHIKNVSLVFHNDKILKETPWEKILQLGKIELNTKYDVTDTPTGKKIPKTYYGVFKIVNGKLYFNDGMNFDPDKINKIVINMNVGSIKMK